MSQEIKLPELGENLEGGEVLDIKVSEGDEVSQGQALIEVDAEKSTVEVPAPVAGRVSKILVKQGDDIRVGQVFCVMEESADGEEPPTTPAQKESKQKKPEPEAPPPAAEEKPAPKDIESDGRQQAAPTPRPPTAASSAPEERTVVPAGPATRRLARELGVDLRQVPGTAPRGRVTPEDVKAFVRQLASGPLSGAGLGMQPPPLPDFERWGPVERHALEAIRRRTAEQMALAWAQIPHVTQHDLADITDLDAFRRQHDAANHNGPKLTVTAFALKAAAITLKEMPRFNSSLDLAGGHWIQKQYYHIGVAVDTERGLLVPVIRDVDRKSVRQLAQELADRAARTRAKKITADEMRGGTFTITNLGGIGGTSFTPIVNYPEVAILGLSRASWQPAIRDGQVVPRLLMPLSLSYDHRVIDGADAARFTRRIAALLEQPLLMVLDG
ncbi:MAG: 2-oxo acid dehydrogenase subunit E2 [Gemmataceae bacterium]